MIRIVFTLPDDRERERLMPAVPRAGDHIGWQPDPDGFREEHTVDYVCWELDEAGGPYALVKLVDRTVGGQSVNAPSAPWPTA